MCLAFSVLFLLSAIFCCTMLMVLLSDFLGVAFLWGFLIFLTALSHCVLLYKTQQSGPKGVDYSSKATISKLFYLVFSCFIG